MISKQRIWSAGAVTLFAVAFLGACASNKGGYYQDDGPGNRAPAEFVNAPDVQPRDEPIVAASTRPYVVFGKQYVPMKQRQPLVQNGVASWYGTQFHGRSTSIGEKYDMYAMSAAHPTLPLPSYVRVLNRANGRSVVVRVNDRGPFLNDRIIDLSYAAAAKLGYVEQGTANVALEVVDPMVVTLQSLRQRRGLPTTESILNAPLARAAAATTPAPARPERKLLAAAKSGRALTDARVNDRPLEGNSQALTTARPKPVAPNSRPTGPAGATPNKLPAAAVEPAVKLSAKAPRRVADVLLPIAPPRAGKPVRFVPEPAPYIEVQSIEGKGVRPARAERYKVPRKPAPVLALNKSKKDEKFVVPYKDRLPVKPKGAEPKPRVYLQLGAYETEKAARAALTQAGVGLRWLRQPVSLLNDRGMHKLQAGPFPSSRQARKVARRIRSESRFTPFYVFR